MSKYRNEKTVVDGITFDSRKEAGYYKYLKGLEADGKIRDLRLQVKYELLPAIWRERVKHLKTKDKIERRCPQRAVYYIADFVYIDCETGKEEVVDVKGRRTKEYILKKKMMFALKGIEIVEV